MILFTHHHGTTLPWEGEGFATHPVMGFLMCSCSILHMATSAAHLAHPAPNGRTPDLCSPLPGGGTPALRMSRLVGAFAYLLLGFFLYIDTHMGCRQQVVLVGEPNTGPRLGHSAGSEISTYLSCTFVLSSLALALLIWSMPMDGDEHAHAHGGAKVSCANQQLHDAADTEGEGCSLLQEEGVVAPLPPKPCCDKSSCGQKTPCAARIAASEAVWQHGGTVLTQSPSSQRQHGPPATAKARPLAPWSRWIP